MTEAIRSSETTVLTRATKRHIPDDDIVLGEFSILRSVKTGFGTHPSSHQLGTGGRDVKLSIDINPVSQ
jgi:hypothetical protein